MNFIKYLNHSKYLFSIFLLNFWLVRRNKLNLIKIGEGYGSYFLPFDLLDRHSYAWMVGAGENITLDLYLASFGMDVTIIDPTPRAVAYAKKFTKGIPNIRIIEKGIWNISGFQDFFLPINPDHVSLSLTNLQNTSEKINLPVISYSDLARDLGHYPNILKLDVEGAAISILRNVLEEKFLPEIILVEFEPGWKIIDIIKIQLRMKMSGYFLIKNSEFDCLYVRSELYKTFCN